MITFLVIVAQFWYDALRLGIRAALGGRELRFHEFLIISLFLSFVFLFVLHVILKLPITALL